MVCKPTWRQKTCLWCGLTIAMTMGGTCSPTEKVFSLKNDQRGLCRKTKKKKYKNWKIQSCEKIRTVYESLEFFKHFWTLGDLTLNIWKLKKVFLKCCPKFDLKRMQLLVRMNHIFSYIKWLKPHTGESHSVHMIRTLMPGILPRLNLRCLDRSAPDCWSEGEENDEFQRAVRGSQNQGCCHLRVWKRI